MAGIRYDNYDEHTYRDAMAKRENPPNRPCVGRGPNNQFEWNGMEMDLVLSDIHPNDEAAGLEEAFYDSECSTASYEINPNIPIGKQQF